MTDAESEEAIFDELLTGHAVESLGVHALRLNNHLVSEGVFIGMAIRFTMGENVPDGNQHFAGDSNDGFVGVFGLLEMLVLSFSVGITTNGGPSSFDQSPTEFFAAFFGDGFILVLLSAVVDTGTETGIADQFLGAIETGDITNRR